MQNNTEFILVIKRGRINHNGRRVGGAITHAQLLHRYTPDNKNIALCGTRPGISSGGWQAVGPPVRASTITCMKCRRRFHKLTDNNTTL